ncbi:helix-turn-helix transcriptional regulator [Serratia ureilytica]|uniref:helix-turn-helix transcriptional regulator n=1 Tax=Serratia TaxID=613 RepID=UPI0018D6404E|nr:LuxR family transcriptional regulator [Serratia ureilytica]MBH2516921.1 helix-turn-helix transcriptional regulator [Serratia ureilytica]MBH2533124.1 helix-turn-helix transcriptional regulator [Serratia ureilytica]BEL97247.1 hypothetical protein SM14BL09_44000 [Serratia marcescens]
MKSMKIIIDDENHYFAAGLKHCLVKYAQGHNKALNFLTPGCGERPDLLLVSAARRTRHWPACAGTRTVTIKARRSVPVSDATLVLYRMDDKSRVFEVLAEALKDEVRPFCLFPSQSLTPRERQVVGYLRRGLDQSQTARVMGVSVKTVHSHKRSVMGKLMLNRNHEFIYWLLSQKEDYS